MAKDNISQNGEGNVAVSGSSGVRISNRVTHIHTSPKGIPKLTKAPESDFADFLVTLGRALWVRTGSYFIHLLWGSIAVCIVSAVALMQTYTGQARTYFALLLFVVAGVGAILVSLFRTRRCPVCDEPYLGREHKPQDVLGREETSKKITEHRKLYLRCDRCKHEWDRDIVHSENKTFSG